MTVISYTLEKCQKCMKCLHSCLTGAISLQDARVKIDSEKCTNCATCIEACVYQGLQAKGSTLADLENYQYKIALVSTAVVGECCTVDQVEELMMAIKKLGFDEVINLSGYDGAMYEEMIRYVGVNHQQTTLITSFCPVVNKLIEVKYPILLSNIVPMDNISEVAARSIRKREDMPKNTGIFLLCECVSKLTLAKYPYGNKYSEIDHAMVIADLFPQISRNLSTERLRSPVSDKGLYNVTANLYTKGFKDKNVVVADGLDKVVKALELAEFDRLKDCDLLFLSGCINGCIGGNLLWGNPFSSFNNVRKLAKKACETTVDISNNDLYGVVIASSFNEKRSLQNRLANFIKINEYVEKLPGFDCGACGFHSCRAMAEEILANRATLADCRVLRSNDKNESE
ncbi:MAG: [Fe-Fe] hydrogenase large subunit C-terminal domain-containing protein [Erysipelotrichaceae bacterium]|nr:[Fe-Fe] hydrogenase large subunit C-terminal domain-containing protein [Erysipelotrichaceae bacterium]MDD3923862.1 [Fe-Fe] hydrogenase large subunit C-terminal domain-containing protein [Erysipelotrichaceae bacterium]MDD4641914.1 [Fe-Fe] hydrogenase large subunit C-terminal domain-containing protein [Erysipelotrichaceae bacterium]